MSDCLFNLSNQSDIRMDEDFLKRCAETVCAEECAASACEVNLLICGDGDMRDYNRLYRGDDSVTDVLSFDPVEALPGLVSSAIQAMPRDIIIDINQLDRQKGSNTLEKELLEVFIHGLLHTFGYDHIRRQDLKLMTDKEQHYRLIMEGTRQRG